MRAFLKTYAIVVAAALVLVVGFAGNLQHNVAVAEPRTLQQSAKIVLDSLMQSLQLFTLGNPAKPGADNWALVLGRLGGAIVAFVTLYKVVLVVLGRARERARLATLRGHAVIAGFGERGRLFAQSVPPSTLVVALDQVPSSDPTQERSVIKLQGDARDAQVLAQTNLARADWLVIGTGSDERNLSIATRALAVLTADREQAFQMWVTLEDPGLVDAIEREDAVMRPAAARKVQVQLFNPPRAAALDLLSDPFWARRALQLGQPRVRLAVFGASDAAIELILQFLRVSPCAGLAAPDIHLVAPRESAHRRVLARAANLVHLLDPAVDSNERQPLHWAATLTVHDGDPEHDPLARLLPALDAQQPYTAMVVAATGSVGNIQIALQLRRETERLALPICPIHVYTPNRTSLDSLLRRLPRSERADANAADIAEAADANHSIAPFGRNERLCRVGQADAREQIARRLHDAYRERALAAGSGAGDESQQEWQVLRETYRRANRRAADQLPSKWLAANGLAGLDLQRHAFPETLTPELLEALAQMEHDSWRIDRELDGWCFGETRDNHRQWHPDLLPYARLSEATKEYDRAQVRAVWGMAPGT